MSPQRADDLIPVTYSDFSSGLWERGNDRECPPNGLLEAQDCMPLPTGGLRAAWAWTEETLAGLPTTGRKIAGMQVHQNERSVSGFQSVAIMLGTTGNSSGVYERWSALGIDPVGITSPATPWSSGARHLAIRSMVPVAFKQFAASSVGSVPSWYYNVADSLSTATAGVWRPLGGLNSTATVHVYTTNVWYLTVHQNRLVYVVDQPNFGIQDQLIFTEPSTEGVPPSSNVLVVNADRAGGIHWLEPAFPNDLFVLKYPRGAYSIQGDIAGGPIVRDSLNLHVPETYSWGTRIPGGMAYMTKHEGVWLWSGGEQVVPLSPQIIGSPMATEVLGSTVVASTSGGAPGVPFLGQIQSAGRWLFSPTGYIYDTVGHFWIRSTLPSQDSGVVYPFWSDNPSRGRIYSAGSLPKGGTVRIISASYNESTMIRSGTFSATLPIIDTTERNVELRRIEIFGQGFGNGGTWQLELSNDKGQTETTDPLQVQARAASVRANTKLQGDWLKVRLLSEGNADASSSTGKSEAPMIERVVLYLRSRQTRTA